MSFSDQHVKAGQAVYAPFTLFFYDMVVHRFSNRWLWKCPTHQIHRLYDRNVSGVHVDVGVGTGLFLAKSHWPVAAPDITLVDLNRHCLTRASRRIAALRPRTIEADVLQPWPHQVGGPFQSAGLCYLLHCLPGTMPEKAVVFDHLIPHLAPRAHVFGATILQGDTPRNAAARKLMEVYNRRGIFTNAGDTWTDLMTALETRFDDVVMQLEGCVALFEAKAR